MGVLRCGSLFVILTLASVSSTASEAVESLSSATFNTRIQNSDIILVKFYAPWCGHCKAMAPAYEEAASRLANHRPHPILLAKVDATKEPDLNEKQGVRGFPTLKIYRRGVVSDYGGPRDADGIVNYMIKEYEASGGRSQGVDAQAVNAAANAEESPLLVAKLCRDQQCDNEEFPIMEYDEDTKKCHCAAHPCWDDDGKVHSCDGNGQYRHLVFSYTKEGKLECGCRAEPHYMSKYIAKVKCPGEHCESPEHPVVDYDAASGKCVCKKHPCEDVDGVRHMCTDAKFPVLNYREDSEPGGSVKKICECKARFHKKDSEL